ncbi:MAG: metalloregulator ArsR/SmtB family transcription factor [Deltaproteobacteria bacterium]|nr:metalloregulator ArsR/SmtB family transcription factor [Deltaproteobacteria bacterium]
MEDTLTLTFFALADPTRRAILAQLAQGEATVKDLAKPFAISAPAITKHLKVLENARLISRSRDAQFRPCRIEPAALREIADWVDEYKTIWEQRFDQLDAYLKQQMRLKNAEAKTSAAPKRTNKTNKKKGSQDGNQK